MQVNIVSCIFVLDSEKNNNIRKNDIKKLKVILNETNELPAIKINNSELKTQAKNNISDILGSNIFHLEQVYTMDCENNIDIIYLAITNITNVKKLKKGYKLIDFNIKDNSKILLDNKEYKYKTIELEENKNIEYIHEINIDDITINRLLMDLLISYKRIRNNIDSTDIVFKFLTDSFTLEDVRIVYELIKDCKVDKSNYRKKIIKYCEKIYSVIDTKNGFRPSQKYRFKPLKGDIWI